MILGGKSNNNGSIVIEMCIIGPILVFVVFIAINMMLILVNKGIVIGEIYAALYNQKIFTTDNGADVSCDSAMNEYLYNTLNEKIVLQDSVKVSVSAQGNQNIISKLYTDNKDEYNVTVKYGEMTPGVFMLTGDNSVKYSICVKEDIRDVSDNLRRWQIYGQMLSD